MAAEARSTSRRPVAAAIIGSALLILLAAIGGLVFLVQARTAPWPQRAAVRLEPLLPPLAESAVTPDNAFFYLRELGVQGVAFTPRSLPEQAPAPAGGEAPECPGGVPDGQPPSFTEEEERFSVAGYAPDAYPLHEQVQANAAAAFALCEQAAVAPTSQVVTVDRMGASADYLAPLCNAVRAHAFRIEKQAYHGQWGGVVADARTALACSRRTTDGGILIDHLVAIAGNAIVCSSLRRVALRHEAPPEAPTALLESLAEQERLMQSAAETLRYQLLVSQGAVDVALGKRAPLGGGSAFCGSRTLKVLAFLRPNPATVKHHLADCYSLLVHAAELPYSPDPPGKRELDRFAREVRGRPALALLRGDPFGRVLAALLFPAIDTTHPKAVLGTATLRGTALVLALHDWRRQHGAPPARLEELVPQYFAAVPADPFTGAAAAPFVYSVEGHEWRLRSVGPNQRDDGGRAYLRLPERHPPYARTDDVCFDSTEFVPEPEEAKP